MKFVLLLALLAWTTDAFAAASACPPYSKAIVLNFQTETPTPTYNHNLNVAGIRNLTRGRGQGSGGPHARAVGLTSAEAILSLRGSSLLVPFQGGSCVYMTSVGADLGWQRHEVFIASELREGGCAYRAVLDHENQHVAINRQTMTEFTPRIRAQIEEALHAQQPVFTRDADQATQAIIAQIHARTTAAVNQFTSTLDARQSVLDTAKNYGATSALCKDWGNTR